MVEPTGPVVDPPDPPSEDDPPPSDAAPDTAAVARPFDPARSRARWLLVLAVSFLCFACCCGLFGLRAGGVAPGSTEQTAARAVAQRYLDAISAHDWPRAYELSDPATQSAQTLEVQEGTFLAHPDLFDFDDASFEGFQYFANMMGGDRLQLTGRLTGRSSRLRTFRMGLLEQDDGSWRVRSFHVTLELAP
jgi:hypothetical protein